MIEKKQKDNVECDFLDKNFNTQYTTENKTENKTEIKTENRTENSTSERTTNSGNFTTNSELLNSNYKIIIIPNLELYKEISSFMIKDDIPLELVCNFIFNTIPKDITMTTNINIRRSCLNPFSFQNNNDLKNFDYELELMSNNKVFLIGKVVQILKRYKIKLYITVNYEKFKYIGKIESNFLRNEYQLKLGDTKNNYKTNMEISYNLNLLGLFGLRIINVKNIENNLEYTNEIPEWSLEYKTFELNFNKRVRLRSFKNFILKNKTNKSVLQCGKIDDNTYALDFLFPFAPIQAFAIGITSVINKITC